MATFHRPTARTSAAGPLILCGRRARIRGRGSRWRRSPAGTRPRRYTSDLSSTSACPRDGYAWWYVDGHLRRRKAAASRSSPSSARSSPRGMLGRADENPGMTTACLNVATYGPGGRLDDDRPRERRRSALERDRHPDRPVGSMTVGERTRWSMDIDECAAGLHLVNRLRGPVTIHPERADGSSNCR
jgi:hypothetical protein